MITNRMPNVLMWIFDRLQQSHLAREDLIMFIIAQNVFFAALAVAWIATNGQSFIRHRKRAHSYLEPTTQPLTEPIVILVTKVVTVQTEYGEIPKGASVDHADPVKALQDCEYWSDRPFFDV